MNRSTLLESISYVRAAVEELHEAHVDVPMDEETQTRFDDGVAAVASWTADLDALEARDAAIRDLPSRRPASSSAPVVTAPDDLFEVRDINRGPSRRTDMRDRALRVLETTADNFRETNHLDHVERLVRTTSVDPSGDLAARIVVCSDPDYIRGFGKLVTDQSYALSDPERRAVSRAVEVGVTTEGGFAVPTHLDATFIGPTTDGSANPLRALASVKTLAFGNTWNGISTGGVTAAMAAEEAEVADSSLVFAQPSIAAEKAHAYAIYSDEAAQDIDGLVSELGVLFSDAKDQLEATQMVTGSGTTPNTTGIVTGLVADTTPVTSATTDVFAVADVYALREAVGPRHRGPGFAWLAPLEIIDDIRQFGSALGHAFTTDLTGDVTSLMTRPLHEVSAMDGVINASAENYVMIAGNIARAFAIVDRLGMTAKANPLVVGSNQRPTGQQGVYVSWRFGSGMLDSNACRILNIT